MERRSPLRRTGGLRQIGGRARLQQPYHDYARRIVRNRSNGRCENPWCGTPWEDVQWHHLFGRAATGVQLGDAWASTPELTIHLCFTCHAKVEGRAGLDLELRQRLQAQAVHRLAQKYNAGGLAPGYEGEMDPIIAIRALVNHLKALDVTPEGYGMK